MNFNVSTIVNNMGSHTVCTLLMYQDWVVIIFIDRYFEPKHVAEFLILIIIYIVGVVWSGSMDVDGERRTSSANF